MARSRLAKPLPKNDEISYKNRDVIVSSNVIKKLFIQRCLEMNMSPYDVAFLGLGKKKRFIKNYWLDTVDPRVSKSFTQDDVIELLKYVGIEIKITAILKPLENSPVQELKERLNK